MADIRPFQGIVYNPEKQMIGKIEISINVPPDFPEKYHDALIKSAALCAVKKHMQDPPEFEIVTNVVEPA